MLETLEGEGILVSAENPEHGWKVKYHFSISTNTVRTPGFPPVASHSSSTGSVVALNGQSIPDGYYQLTAEDGEILRLKNMSGQWVILAPGAPGSRPSFGR